MEDILESVKDCIQQSIKIYNQDKFNIFIDLYNNVLGFKGDKKENLKNMFNILLDYDDLEKINIEDKIGNNINIKKYEKIADGTYSIIYKGTMNREEIILRIPRLMPVIKIVDGQEIESPYNESIDQFKNKTLMESLEENLLGVVLYCYIKNFPDIFKLGNPFIEIKSIFVLYTTEMVEEKSYNIPLLITGMEKIEESFNDILHILFSTHLFGILAWISFNLKKLQQIMLFTHRDFHTGNIMFNRIQSTTIDVGYIIKNQIYRPYIIDLGESCVNLGCDGCKDIKFPQYYNIEETCNNNSHDLRTLLSSMYISYFRHGYIRANYEKQLREQAEEERDIVYKTNMYMSDIIHSNFIEKTRVFRKYLEIKFQKYLDAGFTNPHSYYEELLDLVDPAFLPETILNEIKVFFGVFDSYESYFIMKKVSDKILQGDPGCLKCNRFDINGIPK